jgi:hypothetical protein
LYKPIQKLKNVGGKVMLTANSDSLEVDVGTAKFTKDLTFHGDRNQVPGSLKMLQVPDTFGLSMEMGAFRSLFERIELASNPDAERREYLKYLLLDDTSIIASDGSIVSHGTLYKPLASEPVLVHPGDLDPAYKTLDKRSEVDLAIESGCFHLKQDNCAFSVQTESGSEFPDINRKFSEWDDTHHQCTVDVGDLKEGVSFLDALGDGDNVRLIAAGHPLNLKNGKFSDNPSDMYQVGDEATQFPSSEIRRDFLKEIGKNAVGELELGTREGTKHPVVLRDQDVTWYVMKISNKTP